MTTTARSTPGGTKLLDGFPTKIAFAADPDVSFWEKTVTPPGRDGGDAIDTTDMFNILYRTKAARSLVDITNGSSTVAYDPAVGAQIDALVNVTGWITIHYPDGSTEDFVGFLKSFIPNEIQEGEQPTAQIEIIVSNDLAGTETAPDYTAPA